ncbi:MAG TPA: PH domain-containing protein [Candidatus Limnocylindrales bacterium]|nr:PH domain-containing protein [Candidatus Limnocylindrales bacterium]
MAYIDGLLASGERPVRREHQHWFVLVADAAYGIIAVLIAIGLLFLSGSLGQGGLRDALGWLIVVIVVGGLIYMGWQVLRWMNEEFIVTTRRVLQLEGVINKKVTDSSLEKINDAILTQSLFGRIFGYGDLDILTASETGISRLRKLRDADDFKRSMLEAKHELELELSGAKPLPSPPLRAAPQDAPSAPATPASGAVAAAAANPAPPPPAPGAAPAPSSPQMSADDVTRTLASLADLHERGAISTEEYEAKKADLLRRL